MSLLGKVAIVSGAAQGLGRAFSIRLAEGGVMFLVLMSKKKF
jgi:NAD(P)-dependent dehydrogenase (short-subunit alcohol dehydrogenase family)